MNTPTLEPSRCLPMRSTRCWNGPRWTLAGAFRKSDSATRARTGTTPAPALPAHGYAVTSALAGALALMAATPCAAVLVSAPLEFVARLTVMSLPVMSFGATATLSGESATPGLRNSARIWLPPSWPQALAVSTTAEACACAADTSTGWILSVKSPRSPWKPKTSKVYVPAVVNVRLMTSGLVPVSIVVKIAPLGSLSLKMKSVEPDGIPSTVATTDCPAVAVNGIAATGAAAVISPVVSTTGSPRTGGGAEPMAPVPNMIADDLRW